MQLIISREIRACPASKSTSMCEYRIKYKVTVPQHPFACKLTDRACMYAYVFSENNTISVWNNGKGIPVVEHKVEKVYVPALIFGQLLTSSNYDDDEKKVTGKTHAFECFNIH